jgi:diguanylate cyclase (GGDEF)-like protein
VSELNGAKSDKISSRRFPVPAESPKKNPEKSCDLAAQLAERRIHWQNWRMPAAESVRLLQMAGKIASVRELEQLIGLILRMAQTLAGTGEPMLALLQKGTDTAFWFDANGQKTSVDLDAATASACARVLRNHNSSRLEQSGNMWILPLQAGDEARSAIVLRGLDGPANPSQLAALKELAGYAGACIDTALSFKRMVARIRFLENYDHLVTKLPNRAFFRSQLGQALEAVGGTDSLAVLFIDLDHFERINREFGHDHGDVALFHMAQRMAAFSQTREMAYLPARVGGDEFAFVVLQQVDSGPIEELAGALLRELETPLKIGPVVSSITASAGIATYPPVRPTLKELIRASERAMYKAKELGGNQCYRYEHAE